MKRILITKKGAKRLRGGHPWVFRGEITDVESAIEPGEIVQAFDPSGYLVGVGFYNSYPLIAFRLIKREDGEVNSDYWKHKLELAYKLRKNILTEDTNAVRLVHAEADGIPGLVIDKYDSVLVVQTLTAGIERDLQNWIERIVDVFKPKGILARNDQKTRELEHLIQEKKVLYGDVPSEIVVKENGWKFWVDLWNGQKTGVFLDQRENRMAVQKFIHGRVLDAFCYQGWFAIQSANKAECVIAADGSLPALEMVSKNMLLNNIDNITPVQQNIFDYLYAMDKAKEKFDVILLDPPAFAKSRDTIQAGIKGYKEINLRAMRLLSEGGILVTSSCSFHLSEELFLSIIDDAARSGGRKVQLLEKRAQGIDHPILLTHPESYYLKCFILRII